MGAPPRRVALPLALVAAALGCAAGAAGRRPAEVAFREGSVVTGQSDADLAAKSDQQLLAIGDAASASGDHARAAAAFDHLADLHPRSPYHAEALLRSGLAHRRLGHWQIAAERFRQLADGPPGRDADEARLLLAEALWRQGRRADARAVLDALVARADLPADQRVRALADRGIVAIDDGDGEGAERWLQQAAAGMESMGREVVDPELWAKVQFHLGEVARSRFLAAPIDPTQDGDALSTRLEEKAQLLLTAQERYFRAIRRGAADWAVAAGARVGELYDDLYRQLVEAPAPADLDADQAALYRSELRRTARVLVSKAMGVYEETLSAARRAGVEHEFVSRTEESLARLRRLLAAEGEPPPGG
jgi:tetratricopeptide (TPR) repeat protein